MNARSPDENAVVFVRWDRPRSYNGRLIGYTVESCAVNPDGTMEQRGACPIRQTKPNERFLKITNLENDRRYRFIVYGSTNAGRGDPNSKDIVTLPESMKLFRKQTKPNERFLKITNLESDRRYRFIVYGSTNAGRGDPNSKDIVTLPESMKLFRKSL
ncbi:unnamed protein product [Gongylonema pulchrum]|uniref:Fibronectin type-III domain-containing protein n=1 Tax=Gongylonema pulchrum TaxID=637853 RepID=A0A183E3K4_9BILA|nr:unnamed protein product [Gongylonema pulchrum]